MHFSSGIEKHLCKTTHFPRLRNNSLNNKGCIAYQYHTTKRWLSFFDQNEGSHTVTFEKKGEACLRSISRRRGVVVVGNEVSPLPPFRAHYGPLRMVGACRRQRRTLTTERTNGVVGIGGVFLSFSLSLYSPPGLMSLALRRRRQTWDRPKVGL